MTITLGKTNYPGTDKDTTAPVLACQHFYQEKQQPKKCTLHSMNHFAGRHVIGDITKLFQFNNEYWKETWSKAWDGEVPPEEQLINLIKEEKRYLEKLEDMEKDEGGFSTSIALLYMQQYREEFGLPKSNEMQVIYALPGSDQMKQTIAIIEQKSHRIMLNVQGTVEEESGLIRNVSHTITLRRDITLRWRILDSMIHSHNEKAKENSIERLQPSFTDLTTATKTIMQKYHAKETTSISFYYPEKDSIKWWIEDAIKLPTRTIKLIDGYC